MSLIHYVTKIHFADGVVDEALASEAEALGLDHILVMTDAAAVIGGFLDAVLEALPRRLAVTACGPIAGEPTEDDAIAAAQLYARTGCDSILGLGGGGAIDLAKAAALLVSHPGPLVRYAAVEGGIARIRNILPPLIAIPTTAGPGAEVGRGAVLTLRDGRRLGIVSPHLVPRVAICDPTLTLALPTGPTASTGMDAITHCIEAFLATAYNPPADGIAIDGLTRAANHLERAVRNGGDPEARREMLAAAMNGGLALQKGLGAVHALSHALGALQDYALDHGTLNAVLLPHVLAFNAPAVAHRYAALHHAMGAADGIDLPQAITNLVQRLGLPGRLREMGVDEPAILAAAPLAEKDYTHGTNPRQASAADYRRIMQAAL